MRHRLRFLLSCTSAVVLAVAIALWIASAGPSAASSPPAPVDDGDERIELIIFYGEGCPYCAAELKFLDELQQRYPSLDVLAYEVWGNEDNRDRFRSMAAAAGFTASSVPTTFLADRHWVGFDSAVRDQIDATVAALAADRAPPVEERTTVDVPFVGTVDVGDSSLVAATLLIGFVDGVNPCSFWVLSMLLALVLHSGSRARTAIVGIVFLTITSALYGLYMFGAYSVLDYAGELTWIRVAVAVVAGTFGVLHVKEYVTSRGPSVTISDRRKPGMYRRMRGLARPDRSMPAVLGGTAALAVGVSLAETPCTAGLPLLWTDLVSDRDVPPTGVFLLFVLYLSVFLLDELIVFGAAVLTLRAAKLQERQGRVLQLVSGVLMLALAGTMLFAPQLLESLTGTIVVFAVAAATCLVIILLDPRHPPSPTTRVRRTSSGGSTTCSERSSSATRGRTPRRYSSSRMH